MIIEKNKSHLACLWYQILTNIQYTFPLLPAACLYSFPLTLHEHSVVLGLPKNCPANYQCPCRSSACFLLERRMSLHWALYILLWELHTINCTTQMPYCILNIQHWKLHNDPCTFYKNTLTCTVRTDPCKHKTTHLAQHTAHCTLHIDHIKLPSTNSTFHTDHITLQSAHCSLHADCITLHSAQHYTLHNDHLRLHMRVYLFAHHSTLQASLLYSDVWL